MKIYKKIEKMEICDEEGGWLDQSSTNMVATEGREKIYNNLKMLYINIFDGYLRCKVLKGLNYKNYTDIFIYCQYFIRFSTYWILLTKEGKKME